MWWRRRTGDRHVRSALHQGVPPVSWATECKQPTSDSARPKQLVGESPPLVCHRPAGADARLRAAICTSSREVRKEHSDKGGSAGDVGVSGYGTGMAGRDHGDVEEGQLFDASSRPGATKVPTGTGRSVLPPGPRRGDDKTMTTVARDSVVLTPVALQQALRVAATSVTAAPSIHNTQQPWRFIVGPGRQDLYANTRRRVPGIDPNGRQLAISCAVATSKPGN